jgi:hypothetical protein
MKWLLLVADNILSVNSICKLLLFYARIKISLSADTSVQVLRD